MTRKSGDEERRTITFEVWSRDQKKLIKVKREGKLFDLSGRDLLLFPVGVMCEAIGRDVVTLRRWERQKIWPLPQWLPKGSDPRCKRWYSAAQILMAHEQYKHFSKGSYGLSHSRHFNLNGFLSAVAKEFYVIDAQKALGHRP